MNTRTFQSLLLQSAVICMGVDGEIHQKEVATLKKVISHTAYFLDFGFEEALNENIERVKLEGRSATENYLASIVNAPLDEKQKTILLDVLLRIVDADELVHPTEIQFLQKVKDAVRLRDEEIIVSFPKHLNYFLSFDSSINKFDI